MKIVTAEVHTDNTVGTAVVMTADENEQMAEMTVTATVATTIMVMVKTEVTEPEDDLRRGIVETDVVVSMIEEMHRVEIPVEVLLVMNLAAIGARQATLLLAQSAVLLLLEPAAVL